MPIYMILLGSLTIWQDFQDTDIGNLFINISYTHTNSLRKFLLDETKYYNEYSDGNHYFSRQQNGLKCYLEPSFGICINSNDQLSSEMRSQQCRIIIVHAIPLLSQSNDNQKTDL